VIHRISLPNNPTMRMHRYELTCFQSPGKYQIFR